MFIKSSQQKRSISRALSRVSLKIFLAQIICSIIRRLERMIVKSQHFITINIVDHWTKLVSKRIQCWDLLSQHATRLYKIHLVTSFTSDKVVIVTICKWTWSIWFWKFIMSSSNSRYHFATIFELMSNFEIIKIFDLTTLNFMRHKSSSFKIIKFVLSSFLKSSFEKQIH